MADMDTETIDIVLKDADGKETVFRRCGPFPDLFASEKGEIIRLSAPKQSYPKGYSVVKYRNTSMSVKALVADAWMPEWSIGQTAILKCADGNEKNCHVENLIPVRGAKGRPSGGKLKDMAKIYQCYKMTKNPKLTAEEFEVSTETVLHAVRTFSKEEDD